MKVYDVYGTVRLIEIKFDKQSKEKNELVPGIIGTKYVYVVKPLIQQYQLSKRYGSAKWLNTITKTLLNFHGSDQLFIQDIDISYLERLEAHWLSEGKMLSSIAGMMRAIRKPAFYVLLRIVLYSRN